MLSTLLKTTLLAVSFIGLTSFELPTGWIARGSQPDKYDMGIDPSVTHDGHPANTIKSTSKKINGFGTLMQSFAADKYRNKRVKMTGYVKSEKVVDWAGLWLRVDAKEKGKSLAFDNMEDRKIIGTSDWKKYEVILDVPEGAEKIAYGTLLCSTGQVWFDDIKFEVVDKSILTTATTVPDMSRPTAPVNMDFSDATMDSLGFPKGWHGWIDNKGAYNIIVEKSTGIDGGNALHVQRRPNAEHAPQTVGQMVDATNYCGKRIRLSGYIKAPDVGRGAYLCLGIWRTGDKHPLEYQGTWSRKAKNIKEWTKYEIVMDVPKDAQTLFFGGIRTWKGDAWFDNFSLETVDATVPVTSKKK